MKKGETGPDRIHPKEVDESRVNRNRKKSGEEMNYNYKDKSNCAVPGVT
jgi:hypothetical protein